MNQTSVVQLRNATKRIGNKNIVDDLSFDIPAGEVFGFLGPNGAGMLALLVVCGYATNALFYGMGSIHTIDLFLNQQGQIVQQNVLMQVIKMYGLSIFPVMGYVTLAFAVSTVLRNSALAVGISLFIMIVGNSMIEATAKMEVLKYLPFANSDISLYIFHLPARPEMTLGFSISVLLAYILALSLISWVVFKKRDVSI